MRAPYVIMVAPNGARRTKNDHPALPITREEIVDAVAEAVEAGAQAAHVHVRDEAGDHVLDADRYRALTEALRQRCGSDLIIQITTEAVGRYTPAQQRAVVEAVQPQAVSIALVELFADPTENGINTAFLEGLQRDRTAVQWILYAPDQVDQLAHLHASAVIPQIGNMLFVLGRYTQGQQSQPSDILPFLASRNQHSATQNSNWAVCAFGSAETSCLLTAFMLGGDVRIGFENSLWHADGSVAASNAQRVEAVRTLAQKLDMSPATPDQAKKRLGIES